MKKLCFIVFVLSLLFVSCNNDESTREEEQARLEKMYNEIIEYSQIKSKTCTNPADWNIIKYGESMCSDYFIYNKSIDVDVLRKKADKYREARGKFDAKWGVYYDAYPCQTLAYYSARISCVEGRATLVYEK